ncbi:MAG: nucleoside deaminase [Candidatus Omnitrophota bacterium]
MTDRELMTMAIKEAEKGIRSGDGGPFGAVVAFNGKPLAAAHNRVIKNNDPTQHAEISAISRASRELKKYDLSGCVIYTTTEPCPMCFSAIHWAKINKIFYGTSILDVKALGFNELIISSAEMKAFSGSSIELYPGCLIEECRELFETWRSLPDKQIY